MWQIEWGAFVWFVIHNLTFFETASLEPTISNETPSLMSVNSISIIVVSAYPIDSCNYIVLIHKRESCVSSCIRSRSGRRVEACVIPVELISLPKMLTLKNPFFVVRGTNTVPQPISCNELKSG